MPAMWEISSDLISALNGVRLCGSVQVIDAAEKLVTAARDLDLAERKADRFQLRAEAVVAAQKTFLDTCRGDHRRPARRAPEDHCRAPAARGLSVRGRRAGRGGT